MSCCGTCVLHSIILIELTSQSAVTVLVPNCRNKYGINVVTVWTRDRKFTYSGSVLSLWLVFVAVLLTTAFLTSLALSSSGSKQVKEWWVLKPWRTKTQNSPNVVKHLSIESKSYSVKNEFRFSAVQFGLGGGILDKTFGSLKYIPAKFLQNLSECSLVSRGRNFYSERNNNKLNYSFRWRGCRAARRARTSPTPLFQIILFLARTGCKKIFSRQVKNMEL